MRLFLVELDRLRSRRAVALIVLGAALVTAAISGVTMWETRPVGAAEMQRAQQTAEQEAQSRYIQRDLRLCERDPTQLMGPDATTAACKQMVTPQAEWYLSRSALDLSEQLGGSGMALVIILTALMVIVGTTFAGADWSSGSLSNQMVFVSRRLRVWPTKAAAVLVSALVVTGVLLTAFWLTLFLVAETRGISTGAQVQEEIRWTVARGTLLAALAATGGYALTMLLRSTVGTLAVLFGYAVGGEILLALLPVTGVGRWSLSNNVFAWVRDGWQYYDSSLPCPPRGDVCDQSAFLSLAEGATYLGPVLLVVLALSAWTFHRRDIP